MSTKQRPAPAAAANAAKNPLQGVRNAGENRGVSPAKVAPPASSTPTKVAVIDRHRKRGRVESAGNDALGTARAGVGDARSHAATVVGRPPAPADIAATDRFGSPHGGLSWLDTERHRAHSERSSSLPNIYPQRDDAAMLNIFPDVNPRDLRLAEVRSWYSPWMDRQFQVPLDAARPFATSPLRAVKSHAPPLVASPPHISGIKANSGRPKPIADVDDDFDLVAKQLADELALEDKVSHVASAPVLPTAAPSGSAPKPLKRPVLRLKLEDMPTPQQAEDRANRAATRIIARREAMEKAMSSVTGETPVVNGNGKSATQQAIMRLNFKSYSSGDESDVASPTGRFSVGSAYSPNQGMFTTKMVAVSEAGISSPDSASLHLQENLQRVKEIGRGASGVVYKSIHVPTLKVVAVKDVPVYGRGQRRQMVRELHALYSNLVPIANDDGTPLTQGGSRRPSNGKPRPSPYIVSFYDAFVDRAKNCICLVMEYMSAGSLQDIVLRGGCQNDKVLSRLAAGVMQGLSHIHSKNMVHRDIKPHNLLTNRQGEVKISDFGLAKTLNDNAGMTKTFVGTLLYMAPERIGGGDYSYPADIWSFGLALVSVALGNYPLPTQDGFFGLVDTVANEEYLKLPKDSFSPECRAFVQLCLKTDPFARPSADELLRHPFITKYSQEETLKEWANFVDATQLCEDRASELDSLGDAVYNHLYQRSVKFSFQPQSDYGVSFTGRSSQTTHRRDVSIQPVQMSLQLGLANYLGVPVHQVYATFEAKRGKYNDKLLEDVCFSPQSWTASPGISRRQQLFDTERESPPPPDEGGGSPSIWKKLRKGLNKLKIKKKKTPDGSDGHPLDQQSYSETQPKLQLTATTRNIVSDEDHLDEILLRAIQPPDHSRLSLDDTLREMKFSSRKKRCFKQLLKRVEMSVWSLRFKPEYESSYCAYLHEHAVARIRYTISIAFFFLTLKMGYEKMNFLPGAILQDEWKLVLLLHSFVAMPVLVAVFLCTLLRPLDRFCEFYGAVPFLVVAYILTAQKVLLGTKGPLFALFLIVTPVFGITRLRFLTSVTLVALMFSGHVVGLLVYQRVETSTDVLFQAYNYFGGIVVGAVCQYRAEVLRRRNYVMLLPLCDEPLDEVCMHAKLHDPRLKKHSLMSRSTLKFKNSIVEDTFYRHWYLIDPCPFDHPNAGELHRNVYRSVRFAVGGVIFAQLMLVLQDWEYLHSDAAFPDTAYLFTTCLRFTIVIPAYVLSPIIMLFCGTRFYWQWRQQAVNEDRGGIRSPSIRSTCSEYRRSVLEAAAPSVAPQADPTSYIALRSPGSQPRIDCNGNVETTNLPPFRNNYVRFLQCLSTVVVFCHALAMGVILLLVDQLASRRNASVAPCYFLGFLNALLFPHRSGFRVRFVYASVGTLCVSALFIAAGIAVGNAKMSTFASYMVVTNILGMMISHEEESLRRIFFVRMMLRSDEFRRRHDAILTLEPWFKEMIRRRRRAKMLKEEEQPTIKPLANSRSFFGSPIKIPTINQMAQASKLGMSLELSRAAIALLTEVV